jgi:hypothetical protein
MGAVETESVSVTKDSVAMSLGQVTPASEPGPPDDVDPEEDDVEDEDDVDPEEDDVEDEDDVDPEEDDVEDEDDVDPEEDDVEDEDDVDPEEDVVAGASACGAASATPPSFDDVLASMVPASSVPVLFPPPKHPPFAPPIHRSTRHAKTSGCASARSFAMRTPLRMTQNLLIA